MGKADFTVVGHSSEEFLELKEQGIVPENFITITREFILDNTTDNGSWTRKQFEALGIKYPPRQGWMQNLIGQKISKSRAQKFILARNIFKRTGRCTCQCTCKR